MNHFVCTSTNLIYCITCLVCQKLYIGESDRKLGDRFVEHLIDVQANDLSLSKPVTQHFNLPGHSFRNMQIRIKDDFFKVFKIKTNAEIRRFNIVRCHYQVNFSFQESIIYIQYKSMYITENKHTMRLSGQKV